MDFIANLWLPILVSAVLCFVASSIIWMATPLHAGDYRDPGEKEDAILSMLRSSSFAPGQYYVPWCHGKEKHPETIAKLKSGPWAMLTVMPAAPNMGKMLGLWFLHLVTISLFVAYLASLAVTPASPYLHVFRVAGAAALLAHAGYALPMCIWHNMPWRQLPGRLIDGIIYSLLTAGTFGWLWPHAAAP